MCGISRALHDCFSFAILMVYFSSQLNDESKDYVRFFLNKIEFLYVKWWHTETQYPRQASELASDMYFIHHLGSWCLFKILSCVKSQDIYKTTHYIFYLCPFLSISFSFFYSFPYLFYFPKWFYFVLFTNAFLSHQTQNIIFLVKHDFATSDKALPSFVQHHYLQNFFLYPVSLN